MTTSKKTDKAEGRHGPREENRRTMSERVRQFVDVQQRAIDQSAKFVSGAAKKLSEGNLNVSKWISDYSNLCNELATDLADATRALYDDALPTTERSETTAQSAKSSYQNWLSLQRSVLGRLADYYRGVGQLVAAQSTEPRTWVEGWATLWSDVTADVGDWMQREAGETLRPTAEWMPRYRKKVRPSDQTHTIPISIPLETFLDEVDGDPEVVLFTEGLKRVGGGVDLKSDQVLLKPDQILNRNVTLDPSKVSRSHPVTKLRLYDIPPSLTPGDVYSGLVWAMREGKPAVPVAAIELVIV